jgi:polyphosphate kinase 2 (PPK2 family)
MPPSTAPPDARACSPEPFFEKEAPKEVRKAIEAADKDDILAEELPYDERMDKDDYEDTLEALQIELVKLQAWVKDTGKRVVVVFEGRDAAGKGGTIKRFRENLNPRVARVVALSKPSDANAAVVFPALCRPPARRGRDRVLRPLLVQPRRGRACLRLLHRPRSAHFFRQLPEFEEMLVDEGIHLSSSG